MRERAEPHRQQSDTFTVEKPEMHFTWLKLFREVKVRHAIHWDRDTCYSLDRIYLDPKTQAGRHIQCIYRLYILSVRGGGMSLCVTPLLSFLSPFPHHTHTPYRASNHLPPPSSVHRMIHSAAPGRPSLVPLYGTDMTELGVRSALLFLGLQGRSERQHRLY